MRTDRGSGHLVYVWEEGEVEGVRLCEQTDACENITFPHTSYAIGNDTYINLYKKHYVRRNEGISVHQPSFT